MSLSKEIIEAILEAKEAKEEEEWTEHVLDCSVSPLEGESSITAMVATKREVMLMVNGNKVVKVAKVGREDQDEITCACLMPVSEAAGSRAASNQRVWNCVVVGFRSGKVEFVDSGGKTIIRKQFGDGGKVIKIRSSSSAPLSRRPKIWDSVFVPVLNELVVVYEKFLITFGHAALYRSLCSNRGKLAEARAQGEAGLSQGVLSNVQCKKLLVREQRMTDACIFNYTNTTFNQASHLSMSNRVNETHLRSLGTITSVVTLGTDPFVQFNTPYNLQHQDINELAENVVSTVKSGIFRAATGFIWSSSNTSSSEQEKERKDPEQKLTMIHAFKDPQKSGLALEKSPNDLYAAALDNQNRVLVFDLALGTVVHVWKGYHHAQIGWITSTSEPLGDETNLPPGLRVASLLVIYLPRRGSLEVWSVEKKSRIAEFSVSKNGRLVSSSEAILDTSFTFNALRVNTSYFLDGSGDLRRIVVPMRSIISQTSSSHDLLQEQKLLNLLGVEELDLEQVMKTVRSGRTAQGKIAMLLDVAKSNRLQPQQVLSVLEDAERQLEDSGSTIPSLVNCIEAIRELINLFNLLSVANCSDGDEDMETDDCDMLALMSANDPEVNFTEQFELSEFLKHFALAADIFETGPESSSKIKISLIRSRGGFIERLCQACSEKKTETLEALKKARLSSENVIQFAFSSIAALDRVQLSRVISALPSLVQVIFCIDGESTETTRSLFNHSRRLVHNTSISPQLYFLVREWNAFHGSKEELSHVTTDLARALYLAESFLRVREAFRRMCREKELPFDNTTAANEDQTIETAFNAGNGRVAEIISKWLVDLSFVPKDLNHAVAIDFLDACSVYFPKTSQHKTVLSVMSWEYFRRWNSKRDDLELATKGFECLKSLSTKENFFVHRLATLIWRTFLDKAVREAINVTENRSKSRCFREIGMEETELHTLLNICVRLVRLLLDTDGLDDDLDKIGDFYDDLSLTSRPHLLDHLKSSPSLSSDALALQYQFTLVGSLIWDFEMDSKPLKLFSNQEANLFFQSERSSPSSGLGHIFAMPHNNLVRNYRKRFLEEASECIVRQCLHFEPTEDGHGELNTDLYKDKLTQVSLLGKMWYLSDRLLEYQILSLYKEGHDTLGEEMMVSVSDTKSMGIKLLHVAILRITKFVYESKDHNKKVAVIKPELMSRFSQLQSEAADLPETRIGATKDFLVFLCSLGLDDNTMQSAYECLSLVQTFIKSEEAQT